MSLSLPDSRMVASVLYSLLLFLSPGEASDGNRLSDWSPEETRVSGEADLDLGPSGTSS